MNRAFGGSSLPACCMALAAATSDQRISPATVQDFPLPVLPNTARCLPNSLSGSTKIAALEANGDAPILIRLSAPSDPTIASTCSGVGNQTWSPTDGNATTPLHNSYLVLPEARSRLNVRVPTGATDILRKGNGRSIKPKSLKPGRLG